MIKRTATIAALCLVSLLTTITHAGFTEPSSFPTPPGLPDDVYLGYAIAVDGDTAVVTTLTGQHRGNGTAYVYTFDGTAWNFEQELVPDDETPYTFFGVVADISGDTIVVGAPNHYGETPGKAYIFTRTDNTWVQTQIIVEEAQENDISDYAEFGWSVAIDGDIVVVGNPGRLYYPPDPGDGTPVYPIEDVSGAVFAYNRSDNFTSPTMLAGDIDNETFRFLGQSIDVIGDTIIAVAPGYSGQGTFYVFTDTGNGYNRHRVQPPEDRNIGGFGYAVDMGTYTTASGEENLIAAIGGSSSNSGDPQLNLFVQDGANWLPTTQFTVSTSDQEYFAEVAFGDNILFVGEFLSYIPFILPIQIHEDGTASATEKVWLDQSPQTVRLAATDTQVIYRSERLYSYDNMENTAIAYMSYDFPAPQVTSTLPANGILNVSPDTLFGATFS
ncbi:MAG: FG-GAP repeat protein, partial [Chloroflexota bacterium]